MSEQSLRKVAFVLALGLVYFVAGKFGLSLAFVNVSATAVWPCTGLALAAMLLFGTRVWPVIFVAAFFVNVTTSGAVLAALMIAVGNTLEAVIGAYLTNRFAHGRHAFDRARDISLFVVLVAVLSTSVSATIGTSALALNGLAAPSEIVAIWFTWWLGDAAGALIVTPLILLWSNTGLRWNDERKWEAVLLMSALVVLALAVFGNWSLLGHQNYPLQFVVLPPIVWAGLRFFPRETATAVLVLAAIAVWGTLRGYGPFAAYPPHQALLLLQSFMSVMSATALIMAAIVAERRRAEQRLRDSEERYRVVAETATDAIVTIDVHNVITYMNSAAEKIFGYRLSEMVGRELTMLMPERMRAQHTAAFCRYTKTTQRQMSWGGMELVGLHQDGHEFPLEVSLGEYHENGKHTFTGIVRDITERKRADESQRWLAAIVESSSDAVIGKTLDGVILSWNQAAARMYGYSAGEAVGRPITMLVPPDRLAEIDGILERIRRGERVVNFETERVCKDGRHLSVSLSISPIRDAGGAIRGASTIARDITERKRAEERIRYLAQHDALTGLPNRILFRDRVTQAIAQARRHQQQVAMLFLDLDDFKHINDSLGHQVGDQLLRKAARRLQRCLREGDSVARLGGDEFVINLPALTSTEDAMVIASKILASMRESFFMDANELHISGSIGISLYPTDGEDVEALMRAADTAMYHAKESGRNNYQFFTSRLNDAAQHRLFIANRLHQAVERKEFTLYYQPQVNLITGRIFAAEALLRWRQPDLGLVAPNDFIRIAEETGLIIPLGQWVMHEACKQLRAWRDGGYADLTMAINLSPQQFRRPGFAQFTADTLRQTGIPPSALEMELTEGVLMAQSAENVEILERLADTGVRVAVDDFGTGYSSLAYLQRFPIHTLKIDQSFIDGIGRDSNDDAIISAIIVMAQSLDLNVIAEGVERSEQVDFLKARGCLAAQGFYCREPVPPEIFTELLGMRTMLAAGNGH